MNGVINNLRYIPSREIISAEARIATALGYFQGNNEMSFLDCFIKSYMMFNFGEFFPDRYKDELSNTEKQKMVEDKINSLSTAARKRFINQLNYELKLVQSGLVEEMFNLMESKLEHSSAAVQNLKLKDCVIGSKKVKVNGQEIIADVTLSDYILNAFGITKENNFKAYNYISNIATVMGFCMDIRNCIAHNDEDDKFRDKNSIEAGEVLQEDRYILRSDFKIEIKCQYAESKEEAQKKNFNSYQTCVTNTLLFNILVYLESAINQGNIMEKENAQEVDTEKPINLVKTQECFNAVRNFYRNYSKEIYSIAKGLTGYNINEEECYKNAEQFSRNHDHLFESKSFAFKLCYLLYRNNNLNFGELWAKILSDKSQNINETVYNMITGVSTSIVSNMLYQVFTADKAEDVVKDIYENVVSNSDSNIPDNLKKWFSIGNTTSIKKINEKLLTKIKRIRNATQHGLYIEDFDGGIQIFGTKDNYYTIEKAIENLGYLSINDILAFSSFKEIEVGLLKAKVKEDSLKR